MTAKLYPNRLIWRMVLLLALFYCASCPLHAVPASGLAYTVYQPNGDSLLLKKIGSRSNHVSITTDGWMVKTDKKNNFCYVAKKRQTTHISSILAKNEDARTNREIKWLKKNGVNVYNE